MNHPIPTGTRVVAIYEGCETCAPGHIDKIRTRIRSSRKDDDTGMYIYTLLDGREVNETNILEVR